MEDVDGHLKDTKTWEYGGDQPKSLDNFFDHWCC